MTNVPDNLRAMWTDLYRFFDVNYLMPNTADAWQAFWKTGEDLYKKHGLYPYFLPMINIIAEMIEYRQKHEENEHHPCTLEDMKLF